MVGTFVERENLLRRFNKKQLKKIAKENKIPTHELVPEELQPKWIIYLGIRPLWRTERYDYEKLIEVICLNIGKDKIIEFADRENIDISDLL